MIDFSVFKGEEAGDVLLEVFDSFVKFSQDDVIAKGARFPKADEVPEGMTPENFFELRLTDAVKKLISEYREDFLFVASTLSRKSKEDYLKDSTMLTWSSDAITMLTDPNTRAFF